MDQQVHSLQSNVLPTFFLYESNVNSSFSYNTTRAKLGRVYYTIKSPPKLIMR